LLSSLLPFRKQLLSSLAVVLLAQAASQTIARAQGCANPVACENQNTGDSDWQISGSGDPTIQGFATDISYVPGQTVSFKINTNASNYTIAIYRMGYYGGAGARRITTINPSVSLPQTQPACITDSNTRLYDCGNWSVSASWQIPSNAVSGLYFALLTRSDTSGSSHIYFVVRNDTGHSDILYVTSDETWQAYNDYGGYSLYGPTGVFDLNNRAYKVSYNRPFDTRNFEAATFLFNAEYPMIRFLEANGYDVAYFTNVDEVRNGSLLTNHKIVLSTGHDEYVSGPRRANIQSALSAGVNLAFFSGNEVFWKTRWENSIDGSGTPYRTLVCFKETYFGTGQGTYVRDPLDPSTWTGTWRDPRFSPPADGGRPENALTGTLFMVNGPGDDNEDLSIQVPAADGKMRFWRNTSIATQSPGQIATLPPGTLGYEWDGDVDNGARPAGLFEVSSAPYTLTTDLLLDYGATYGGGNLTHHATMYRAPSGSLVFGAGSVQWAWGLDDNHDNGQDTSDIRMQQATVNLFADMGVQPTTILSGLLPATQSTDTTPPTVTIISPAPGASAPYGSPLTISGTAADAGGGVVGGVEVSTDGGNTWHPASGREQWTYSWYPYSSSGSASVMARAVDDSGNLQQTPASVTFTVSGQPGCPCSLWNASAAPKTASENDPNSIEVGVKFRSDVAGYVTGVRFYKGSNNTGTHVGHLWTLQGALLGSVTFTNETASGWQQANFSSPIAISANTTYIVSYYAPNGDYADDEPYFGTQLDNPPLHAPATGAGGGNGLFVYASGGGFPTHTYNEGNYWVDLVFSQPSPWTISGNVSGTSGATVSLSGAGTGSVTTDSSGNYTFTNVQNGTYTVTPTQNGFTFNPAAQSVTVSSASVSGVNFSAVAQPTFSISGNAGIPGALVTLTGAENQTTTADSAGNYSFSSVVNGSYVVTPTKAQYAFSPSSQSVTVNGASLSAINFTASAAASIWSNSAVPGTADASDNSPVELGVKFRSDVAGRVSAVRFYKGANNTGTHIGNLWTSTGTKLATVTFSNETATGWQQATFSSAVSISANTTYIVSYYAPNGNYAADSNFFAAAGVDNAPLHALQNGVDGPNGVYLYATGGGFPSNSYNSTNYWVDLVFAPNASATYSISGTITNGAGATVTLSGASSATTTANSSGAFTFSNLANGSYTVTPSETGFTFSPASQNVTVNSANVTGINFTATGNTYSISGTITNGAGATVTLSGASSATTTANSSGAFTFSNLANGSYTVTPSETGFTFSPASQNVTVNSANVTGVNFTATGNTYSISGTITNGAGATVTLSGASSATTTANSSGAFTFSNLANGSYTVRPSETGFTFSPASQNVTVNSANVTGINFTATGNTYSISGTITNGAGATVTLSGASSATTTANSSGAFTFSNLANGSYTVTPSETGFTFSPASQNVTVNSANVTGVNFTATGNTYSISGTITNGAGATVTLSGASSATTTANSSGAFTFSNLANGSYTVTPSETGFTFSPASQNVTVNSANVTGVNFTGSAIATYSLSGTITNGASVTVTLSGAASATTTTNSSGAYTFSNLANGSYTVTPSKSGFSFAPANQAVTISGASVTGVNFTGKGLTLDAQVFKDQTSASSSITSPTFSTVSSNELLLAFVGADRLSLLNNTTVSGITGGGLTWVLVKRTNGQNGTAEIWRAFATSALTNVSVKATLNQSVQSSMTVMSFAGVDTSGTNGSGAIGASGGASATSGAPSASLTTARINSWVFGVGQDFDNAIARTPGSSQSLVHQYLATNTGDTYWVQMQNAPTPASGTIVTINDTAPTTDRWNLAVCAVQPAP